MTFCWRTATLRRTWEDFELLAYEMFGEDADELHKHIGRHRLTKKQILYYVNWTLGMSQADLAEEFQTTQPAVSDCLGRLRKKWPFLFMFTTCRNENLKSPQQLDKRHEESAIRRF